MTIRNRDSFLDNVAKKMNRSRRTEGVTRPTWSLSPQKEVLSELTKDELVDILEKQCNIIHTSFKRATKLNLSDILKETIVEYQGNSIVVADDIRNTEYHLTTFYKELQKDSIEVHTWDPVKGKENTVFAERADIGITFSDITLAESGTVTLFNNKENARTISLLPKTYIAIIPKSTLVPRLTQATQQIHEANQNGQNVASCVSFISGPSNSADIEMNLIVGVHGPIKVTYILVED